MGVQSGNKQNNEHNIMLHVRDEDLKEFMEQQSKIAKQKAKKKL